jgi:hypothetical protein
MRIIMKRMVSEPMATEKTTVRILGYTFFSAVSLRIRKTLAFACSLPESLKLAERLPLLSHLSQNVFVHLVLDQRSSADSEFRRP